MEEIWKPIITHEDQNVIDYEGLYEISSKGRVKSLNYRNRGGIKYITGRAFKNGYRNVCLCRDGVQENLYVHRLVADHFVKKTRQDIRKRRDIVYFLDGDPTNLDKDNLVWKTREEVVEANIQSGRHISTTSNRRYLAPKQVVEVKKLIKNRKLDSSDIANLYGISTKTVSHIKTGRRRAVI
jgi:DNA-binding transcriptional regulator YiaG